MPLPRSLVPYLARAIDAAALPFAVVLSPLLKAVARLADRAPWTRGAFERGGVAVLEHHYYTPVVFPADIAADLADERDLPGLDLNASSQLALLREFRYRAELEAIPLDPVLPDRFGYNNLNFASGDAEMLYNMIRHFRPRRLIEIGSGMSTLIAALAIGRNGAADPNYRCAQICVEPYEQPWLERLGVEVQRERAERLGLAFFQSLEAGDILFIDSSHVIRPQGDVLFEFQQLLPVLKPGVIVHVHDIFTPRDYPADYVLRHRRLWNEQYLLESFLAFNPHFEVLAAVNWLWHNHPDEMQEACPILCRQPDREPGSFWLRRRP